MNPEFQFQDTIFSPFLRYKVIFGVKVTPKFPLLGNVKKAKDQVTGQLAESARRLKV